MTALWLAAARKVPQAGTPCPDRAHTETQRPPPALLPKPPPPRRPRRTSRSAPESPIISNFNAPACIWVSRSAMAEFRVSLGSSLKV